MSQRPRRGRKAAASPFVVLDSHAAGIDVGSAEHWVAVPPGCDAQPVRRFGACTADLEALAGWLARCGVESVAMESTGVYWVPLFELLEARGFRVRLVDARQTRAVPGRPKSDRLDCQWIQRLHSCGLLAAAFRPDDQVVVLRGYLRQRQMLITFAGQHVQHVQKALELLNVKLTEVVADVTGATGMAIIKAILAGQRDPAALARLRDCRCKQDEAAIARALYGNWRAEHLFALRQAVELFEFYQGRIAECGRQVEAHLLTFADKSGGQAVPPRPAGKVKGGHANKGNTPAFDARARLYRLSGVDLTRIEGIGENTALTLLGEIGLDMGRWPSVKHFTSWLGLCPSHRISGGKVISRQTRSGASRAAQALRLAARALTHSKSALGAYFRRMKGRLGPAKAITAAAHKLARLVYSLLKHGEEYVARSMEEYESEHRERQVRGLIRKAHELGFELVKPQELAPNPVAEPAPGGSGS
jgi:transposase